MEEEIKNTFPWLYIIPIILVIIVIISPYFLNNSVDNSIDIIDEETAICVAEKSEIYVLDTCGSCKEQKKILGEYLELFNMTECKENPTLCFNANITNVPTWFINGEKYIGIKTVDDLKKITGC